MPNGHDPRPEDTIKSLDEVLANPASDEARKLAEIARETVQFLMDTQRALNHLMVDWQYELAHWIPGMRGQEKP